MPLKWERRKETFVALNSEHHQQVDGKFSFFAINMHKSLLFAGNKMSTENGIEWFTWHTFLLKWFWVLYGKWKTSVVHIRMKLFKFYSIKYVADIFSTKTAPSFLVFSIDISIFICYDFYAILSELFYRLLFFSRINCVQCIVIFNDYICSNFQMVLEAWNLFVFSMWLSSKK